MRLSKTFKQFLLIMGLTILGLVLMNTLFLPQAFAVEVIRPEENPVADITGGVTSIRQLVLTIVQFFLGFLGLLAVLMFIYGGFLYVTSAGNEEKVNQAKKILLYSVIGIVVIIVSFAVVFTLLGGLGTGTST